MLKLSSISLLVAMLGCSRSNEDDFHHSNSKNIFGEDNRRLADVSKDPYRSIGRLENGCTATLIGKYLILTAAHCMLDDKGEVQPNLSYFKPGLQNGNSDKKVWIVETWIGSKTPEQDRLNDWAIARISAPIGQGVSPLNVGSQTISDSLLPYKISLAGYSKDFQDGNSQSVHIDCAVRERIQERLLHDCDSTSGVSGAPLLSFSSGRPEIVGISVSEYRNGSQNSVQVSTYSRESANVGIGSERLKNVAIQLLSHENQGNFPQSIANAIYLKNPKQDPEIQNGDPAGDPGATLPVGNHGATTPVGNPGATTPVGNHGATTPVGNHGATTPVGNPGATTPVGSPILAKSCLNEGLYSNTVFREYDLKPGATIYSRSSPLYAEASAISVKAQKMLRIFQDVQRPLEFNLAYTLQDGALRLQNLMALAVTNGFGSYELYDSYTRICAGTYNLGQSFQTNPWTVEPAILQELNHSIVSLEALLFL